MFKIILGLLCFRYFLYTFGEDEIPLVRVKQGLIRGIQEESLNGNKFYSYMSIPYAEQPVGTLRFKDPVSSKSWDLILDGTKKPVACLQISSSTFATLAKSSLTLTGREDCLHLNVFTSSPNEPEKKLPVMVYIHGGGFVIGSADLYPPYFLMNKNIVLVVIQYRLGIFGFLSTEDSVMPGNMGLKDQQLALKWIKENIESFGGDPDGITIFGESAGGSSVHYQILSPGSKGLFKGAIMQSGTSLCPFASNKNHRKFAIETGREFNCSLDSGTEKYLECMQKVNSYYLTISGSFAKFSGLDQMYVLPRVDGEFIDEAPEILMQNRKYSKVNIISGVNRNEGTYYNYLEFLNPKLRERIQEDFEKFGPINLAFKDEENSLELTKRVYKYYLQRDDTVITEDDRLKTIELKSDRFFKVCHDTVANFFAANNDIKFYSYQLNHFGQVSMFDFPGFNRTNLIAHVDDLPYLFPGSNMFRGRYLKNEEDLKLAEIILDLWVNFAETGNPTPPGSDFIWRSATENRFHHLSLTPSPQMKEDNFQNQRSFWSSLNTFQNLNVRKAAREEL